MKKLIFVFLLVCVLMLALSACTENSAQETTPAEGHESIGLAYTLSNDGTYYRVSGIGNCKDTDIVIPLMHNGLPVKGIASGAFFNCHSLTSVVIPDSVTSIGNWAFDSCYSLTSVVIPDSVTSIGERAFDSCYSLTSVVIPDSVTSIGEEAFSWCRGLTSVVIGDSVTSIGGHAFNDCTGLKNIYYRGTASQWEAISKGSGWNSGTGSYTMTYNYTGQ